MADKEVRSQIYNQFAEIKNEVGEDPKNFLPILVDVIVTVSLNKTPEQVQSIFDSKTDVGQRTHYAVSSTGNAIITVTLGVALVKNLPEIAERLTENIKKVKKVVKQFVENPFDELGKLKKNIRFKTGEFEYFGETDHLGRLEKFETDNLQLTQRTERLPHNPNTPGKLEGDHAGHIFGDRFGGSPELDNLVSQASEVNLSEFKKIENQWTKAIEQGKKVDLEIKIKYDGDGLRPSAFEINYKIGDEKFNKLIMN